MRKYVNLKGEKMSSASARDFYLRLNKNGYRTYIKRHCELVC